jgi:hypothetical protein
MQQTLNNSQDEELQLREEQQRIAAEKARVDAIARNLPVLRLALALTQVVLHTPRHVFLQQHRSAAITYSYFDFLLLFMLAFSTIFLLVLLATQTENVVDGKLLVERLHAMGFTHDATLHSM